MITVPRSAVRRFRLALTRGCGISARSPNQPVTLACSADGTFLRAQAASVALEYHLNQPQQDHELSVPLEALRACEGATEETVTLRPGPDGVFVEWRDAGIPQSAHFDLPMTGPEFPARPVRWVTNPPRLLDALHHASATAAATATRYAIDHVRLRGGDGQVAATDGQQLLLDGGFHFPWEGDSLVPSTKLFALGDLRSGEEVSLGHTDDWVILRCRAWTVWLRVLADGRFPDVDAIVRGADSPVASLEIDEQDARFLSKAIPRLPMSASGQRGATVDLNGSVAVQATGSDPSRPTELVLQRSRRTGNTIRFHTDRRYLARAVELGFRRVEVASRTGPVLCREGCRVYLWALLSAPEGDPPSDVQPTRILPDGQEEPTDTYASRRDVASHQRPMPTVPRAPQATFQEESKPARPVEQDAPPSATSPASVLQQAEALRQTLCQAQSQVRDLLGELRRRKKKSRLVESTLASLRQLDPSDVD